MKLLFTYMLLWTFKSISLQEQEFLSLSKENENAQKKIHLPYLSSSTKYTIQEIAKENYIYNVSLDRNGSIKLFWEVDYESEAVQFEVHAKDLSSRPWISIGFSNRGDLVYSDLCVFWVDWMGKVHFQNVYVDMSGRMRNFDEECKDFKFQNWNRILKFTFTRELNSCTAGHYIIEKGTTHIVWSSGIGPLYRLDGVLAGGDTNGMLRVQLLKPNLAFSSLKDSELIEFRTKPVHVPSDETTYWCSVQKLPDQFYKKHHMLMYEPTIENGNEDIVHHIELFHCELPENIEVSLYQGPCRSETRPKQIDACKRVISAWAMGAEAFHYPEETGMPIGGDGYNPFVMLEIHYNNPNHYEGRTDTSGLRLLYTQNLRKYDAGIMELGLEYIDKMAIPPQMDLFTLAGYCIPECTALSLPAGGVYIFASQLHTHLTGRVTWTKHYRGDKELKEINRDNHYSTHFQEIRRLPAVVQVLPGDALIMGCEFSTIQRNNATVGGFAISDEMCVNYIHYYPKTDLEVCKSSVDSKTLMDYFDFMKRMELQHTDPEKDWRYNYKIIEWTPLRSSFLQDFYNKAPLSMQCNRSSGERFPGYWENKPIPTVDITLSEEDPCLGNQNDVIESSTKFIK